MMKIKKLSAILLAGMLACTAPAPVFAAEGTAEEILMDNSIDSLLSDPGKVVDVIMYVKDLVDQQEVSDDDINSAIDMAAEHFQISLTDSDKESLVKLVNKFKNMDLDEEQLRSQVTKVYDELESLGIGKEEVKGFLEKALEFVKGLFE